MINIILGCLSCAVDVLCRERMTRFSPFGLGTVYKTAWIEFFFTLERTVV